MQESVHLTNIYLYQYEHLMYNVHQKCQELMVPDTPSVSESFAPGMRSDKAKQGNE